MLLLEMRVAPQDAGGARNARQRIPDFVRQTGLGLPDRVQAFRPLHLVEVVLQFEIHLVQLPRGSCELFALLTLALDQDSANHSRCAKERNFQNLPNGVAVQRDPRPPDVNRLHDSRE